MIFELPAMPNVVETGCARRHMYEMQPPSPLLAKGVAWIFVATLPGMRIKYVRNVVSQFGVWENMYDSATMSTTYITLDLKHACANMPIIGIASGIDRNPSTDPLGDVCNESLSVDPYVVLESLSVNLYVVPDSLSVNLYVVMDIFECPSICTDLTLNTNFVDSCLTMMLLLFLLWLWLQLCSPQTVTPQTVTPHTVTPHTSIVMAHIWALNRLRIEPSPCHSASMSAEGSGFHIVVMVNIIQVIDYRLHASVCQVADANEVSYFCCFYISHQLRIEPSPCHCATMCVEGGVSCRCCK
jgi:hypothetical protein